MGRGFLLQPRSRSRGWTASEKTGCLGQWAPSFQVRPEKTGPQLITLLIQVQ